LNSESLRSSHSNAFLERIAETMAMRFSSVFVQLL
jgi:hypothetical protein